MLTRRGRTWRLRASRRPTCRSSLGAGSCSSQTPMATAGRSSRSSGRRPRDRVESVKRLRPGERSLLLARLAAQSLSGPPAAGPLEVTRRLLAVQAQDPRGARLAVRARGASPHASDLDRALTEDRSLVITWVNRGTLHLIAVEDEPLLHALTTPQLRT